MANLLIVDDELSMRQFLTHLFQREGYAVRVAENGRKAMELLQAENETRDSENKARLSEARFIQISSSTNPSRGRAPTRDRVRAERERRSLLCLVEHRS